MITNYPLLRELRQLSLKNLFNFETINLGTDSTSGHVVTLSDAPKNNVLIGAVGINLNADTTAGVVVNLTATTDYTVSGTNLTCASNLSRLEGAIVFYQKSLDSLAGSGNFPLVNEIEDLDFSKFLKFEGFNFNGDGIGGTATLSSAPIRGITGIIDVCCIETTTSYSLKNAVRTTDYSISSTTLTAVTNMSRYEVCLILYQTALSGTVRNYPLARGLEQMDLSNLLALEVFAGSNAGDITLSDAPKLGSSGIIGIGALDCSSTAVGNDSGYSVSGTTLTYGTNLSAYEACPILYQK